MQAIVAKYLPPTNTKGSRIKVECGDFGSSTYGFPYEFDGLDAYRHCVHLFCEERNWNPNRNCAWLKSGVVVAV